MPKFQYNLQNPTEENEDQDKQDNNPTETDPTNDDIDVPEPSSVFPEDIAVEGLVGLSGSSSLSSNDEIETGAPDISLSAKGFRLWVMGCGGGNPQSRKIVKKTIKNNAKIHPN